MRRIKLFENFDITHNEFDPYGEEEWNPVKEQVVTGIRNIYLCVEDDGDFLVGNVYIVMGINQNIIGPNIVGTRVKKKGKYGDQWMDINFNAGEDPFMRGTAYGSLIYIGELDR
jgi:hypothetical protein